MATRRNPADGRRYSNASLGRAIGMNEKTVGNWLRADDDPERTEPGATNLRALCTEFDVAADFLLGRTDEARTLQPGLYIIDLDEERSPSGPEAVVAIEVPDRFEIVARKEAEERAKLATERWRNAQRGKR